MRKTGLKLLLICLLVLILAFTFVSCNKKTNEGSSTPQEPVEDPVDDTPQEIVVAVLTSNEEADPYESSIISSARLVCGAKDKRIVTHAVNQSNIDETIIALKDEGATVVISTNPALETALVEASKLFPKMQFITIGGVKANFEKLGNYHNAYISMHEARYLNGIAAGMKLNQYITNGDIDADSARIGFIATEQSSAQISAYTAFYLGAKSVCSTVKMSVKFATSEQDITDSVNALIAIGCKVISQYSYNDAVVTSVCNEHDTPVPNVTFMSDNTTKYPGSFLTGFNINWRPYFTYLIDTLDSGETLAYDWCGGISNDCVSIYSVNNTIAAAGTADAVQAAFAKIRGGELNVFDTSTFTVDKAPLISYVPAISTTVNALLPKGDTSYVIESNARSFRSYPYFGLLIDGIYYDSNVNIRHQGQYQIDATQLPPEDDTLSPAEKYFTALIAGVKTISAPDLNTQTDKVDISISGYFEYDSDIAHSIKRQYDVDLILDLPAINNETDPSLGDSALRIKITNATNANLITVWYFANDPTNTLYMQYKNEYFKVGLGEGFDVDSVMDYINNLDTNTPDDNGDDDEGGFDMSTIMDVIGNFAKNGNFDDYSMDALTVKSLLMLFDINLDEYLTSPTALALLGTLGLTIDEVQNMTIEELLINFSSFIIDEDQVTIKENLDGSTTYVSKDLSKRIKTLVNSFANNMLEYISFGLSFTVPKDETALSELTFDFYSDYTKYQHFDVRIHVENFEIATVTGDSTTVLEKAATYKDYLEFELTASLDLKNKVSVNIKDEIVPLGKFDLHAYLALDFKGEGSENKTSMEVILRSDNIQILKIVLIDGTIGVDVNLNNVQMQAITNVFLKDICKIIKDYTVGEKSNVAFTFVGDVIDELLAKVFDSNGDINTGFVNITITNIDVPVLARGILSGLINTIMIGVNEELPIEDRVEPTPEVSLSVFSDEDKSSLFSYDVQMSTNSLLRIISNAIKYDATTSKITIEVSDIKNTLKTLYSGGKDTITSTNDIMAYFIGTDDSIILSLTEHGLLPLYKEGTLTTKYIASDYTIEQAIADGYTSMQGAMISKTNATNIWKYVSKSASDLPYTKLLITYRGAYVPKNGDYTTEEEYLNSFAINRYYNMFKNSTILAGKNNANEVLTAILDGTNSISFVYYEEEDKADLTIVMLGETFTAGIDFDLHGVDVDDILVPTLTDTSAIADGNKVVVALDDDFYDLFKALTGTGYGSSITDFGTNNSLYYIASSAVYDAEESKYTSIELSGSAIVLMSDTEFKYVSATETKDGTYTIDEENGVFTFVTLNSVADGTQFDILGSKFKVLVQKA